MKEDQKEWLTGQCNRLTYGQCNTVGCMRRGGHVRGEKPNFDMATCIPYEIYTALTRQENTIEKVV